MHRPAAIAMLLCAPLAARAGGTPAPEIIVAVGAEGEAAFSERFCGWAAHWEKAAKAAEIPIAILGRADGETDGRERLRKLLEAAPKESDAPLWIVLLGHGTYDGREGKFNLRGDDLSASELAAWLASFRRPVVIIAGFSASGAFLKPLSAKGRIVITATKSGAENNYARFGGFFSKAITDPAADLDKDGQTSILEAWIFAARETADFYSSEGRLATEHSLLDDNGDGFGTPPDWFRGVHPIKKPAGKNEADGQRARQMHLILSPEERKLTFAQRAERDRIEGELAALRARKSELPEAEYHALIEPLLTALARIYRAAE